LNQEKIFVQQWDFNLDFC